MNEVIDLPCQVESFAGLSAELLRLGKAVRFKARGSSIRPLVRDGDILLVNPLESSPPRIGEIVLCSHARDRVVVHRVVRLRAREGEMSCLVQGDQSFAPDGWIHRALIYGRVVAIERGDKRMDLRRPLARLAGRLAALRTLLRLGKKPLMSSTIRVLKKIPVFSVLFS